MMFLLDTNVISEIRKNKKANVGVIQFFESALKNQDKLYISVISIGELQRGVELIRHRGDKQQAILLEKWLNVILNSYQSNILDFDKNAAQLWGKLRSLQHKHSLDKQIAATAIIYELTVVTRNDKDFIKTGVTILNPFK